MDLARLGRKFELTLHYRIDSCEKSMYDPKGEAKRLKLTHNKRYEEQPPDERKVLPKL